LHNNFKIFAGLYLDALGKTFSKMEPEHLWKVLEVLKKCPGTIWLIGNGGSAALASHMATDLQLAGLRAISLTDVTAITTAANDHSYEFSFVSQLDALARGGDVLIAISGSGTSLNIVRATEWAMGNGLTVVGMSGFKGGKMQTHHLLHIPVDHIGQAQDAQQIMLHMLAYWLMEEVKL
jgi:D-sedoheptulose 7-phosphate isomerase